MSSAGPTTIVTVHEVIRRHIRDHIDPYYDWIKHVVSLSSGSLTALLALQGHYVPKTPVWPWLLGASWIVLALTLGLGLHALAQRHRAYLQAAERLQTVLREKGEAAAVEFAKNGSGHMPGWLHRWSVRLMTGGFVVSLLLLCLFAIANLLLQ